MNENPITDPSVGPSRSMRRMRERGEGHVCLKPQTQKYFSTKWYSKKEKRKKNFPFDVY